MKYLLTVVSCLLLLAGVAACSQADNSTSPAPETISPPANDIYAQQTSFMTVSGFSRVNWHCQDGAQHLSFHLAVSGFNGHPNRSFTVTVEDIDPTTQPYDVHQVVTDRIETDATSVAAIEAREYSLTIPLGHHVHAGVVLNQLTAQSHDITLKALPCH